MLQDLLLCEEEISYRRLNIRVIHLEKNSGNASKPRNVGLDNARGEYVTFLDSDDYVSDDYVETIINKINSEDFDYCYFSLRWIEGDFTYKIDNEPPDWMNSVCNCIYKRSNIGNERFDDNKNINEDGDFNIRTRVGKKASSQIEKVLYHFHYGRPESLTTRVLNNEIEWEK
jgi:glycosyltransferase involved in cell wall biosynthesis